MHKAANNSDVNYVLFSVRTFVGMSKLLTQCYKTIVATVVAIVFVVDTGLVNFEKWSVITTISRLLFLGFERGPIMSIAMNVNGSTAGKTVVFVSFPCLPATKRMIHCF